MDTILGQTRAIDQLLAALASGRLHHAYIFHGPAGVGKFTTARAFAKVLLCHDATTDLAGRVTACGGCPSCRTFDAGTHPDLHIIVKELALYSDDSATRNRKLMNIPVDVIREALIEPVARASRLSHGKVFIVDEAELMRKEGQNALLKTLEEPPPGTHIILVTSNEDRLLVTVRSRCQRIAFTPLEDKTVDAWLGEHHAQIEDAERAWLVSFAGGSLGRAALAIEYGLFDWAKRVLPAFDQMAQGRYPVGLGQAMHGMAQDLAEAWVKKHDNASKDAANKLAASLMWTVISQHARHRMAKVAAECDPADPMAGEARMQPWMGVIDAVARIEAEVASNVNAGLAADHLVSLIHRALRGRAEPALTVMD